MIRAFCDSCGTEITDQNRVDAKHSLVGKIISSNNDRIIMSFEAAPSPDYSWGTKEICKYCILDAFYQSDDRVYSADFDSEQGVANKTEELTKLLAGALRAICFTRDYVGEEKLPAINGWEWYDAGKKISDYLSATDHYEWSHEFRIRVNMFLTKDVREKFKSGDWIFGIGKLKGCSEVSEGPLGELLPFSRLNDYNPENYRLATKEEVEITQKSQWVIS